MYYNYITLNAFVISIIRAPSCRMLIASQRSMEGVFIALMIIVVIPSNTPWHFHWQESSLWLSNKKCNSNSFTPQSLWYWNKQRIFDYIVFNSSNLSLFFRFHINFYNFFKSSLFQQKCCRMKCKRQTFFNDF